MKLVDLTFGLEDFADTAALIANLDVVISVDTSVAHVAAALGKPTWVLIPLVSDWRWMLGRTDSPWYPTLRLFRQQTAGDWPEVMVRVETELRKMSGGGTTDHQRTSTANGELAAAEQAMRHATAAADEPAILTAARRWVAADQILRAP